MFTICIKNLRANTVLGVYGSEKNKKRPVVLNISMMVDTASASSSDALKDTVDYAAIESKVVQRLETSSYGLIEKLVNDIGVLALSLDKRIASVKVEADKPGALQHADSVSVSGEFSR